MHTHKHTHTHTQTYTNNVAHTHSLLCLLLLLVLVGVVRGVAEARVLTGAAGGLGDTVSPGHERRRRWGELHGAALQAHPGTHSAEGP